MYCFSFWKKRILCGKDFNQQLKGLFYFVIFRRLRKNFFDFHGDGGGKAPIVEEGEGFFFFTAPPHPLLIKNGGFEEIFINSYFSFLLEPNGVFFLYTKSLQNGC